MFPLFGCPGISFEDEVIRMDYCLSQRDDICSFPCGTCRYPFLQTLQAILIFGTFAVIIIAHVCVESAAVRQTDRQTD